VQRRFREFNNLHEFLTNKFISKFILCPFPERSLTAKFTDRMQDLNRYLAYILTHCHCSELEHWLSLQTYTIPAISQPSYL
jgi:hypothetical protein